LAGFHRDERTRRSGLNNRKLNREVQPRQPPIRCPQCQSQRVWKDGLRHLADGKIQRYLCRDCAFRFSESTQANVKLNVPSQLLEVSKPRQDDVETSILKADPPVKGLSDASSLLLSEDVRSHHSSSNGSAIESLKVFRPHNTKRQVCVPEGGMRNLTEVESRLGKAPRESTGNIESLLFNFAWYLKKNGRKESTIKPQTKLLRILAKRGADLHDPESVKETIARQSWSEGRKENAVNAYSNLLRMIGGKWDPPRYRRVEKLPWIPTEQDVDQLIAGCSARMASFLQLLKETGMRPGEAWQLKWTDIDFEKNIVNVTPEKGSRPRIFDFR